MTWDGLKGQGVSYQFSSLESDRFGLTVGRVTVGWEATAQQAEGPLRRLLQDVPDRLLVVRWPSHLARLGGAVSNCGRAVIPADVLMYWELPADRLRPDHADLQRRELSTVVPTHESVSDLLLPVIRESFKDYSNHYTANPELDHELVALAYIDWASRSITVEPGNVVVLMQASTPIGFATLTQSQERGATEVLLAGLVPEVQGKGLYRHLLAGVCELSSLRGVNQVIISTQAHNLRVQRAWAELGFKPFAAITTVHAVKSRLS